MNLSHNTLKTTSAVAGIGPVALELPLEVYGKKTITIPLFIERIRRGGGRCSTGTLRENTQNTVEKEICSLYYCYIIIFKQRFHFRVKVFVSLSLIFFSSCLYLAAETTWYMYTIYEYSRHFRCTHIVL